MRLPPKLARPLIDVGYNRAKIYLTDDGILLKPFVGEGGLRRVELPKWDDE